jgi:hypothetical protein
MDGWDMVFHPTFNNISVISWWSVLLVEETGVPGDLTLLFAGTKHLKKGFVYYHRTL